jgi:diguanylate cyclase (GGDEF)-like protein
MSFVRLGADQGLSQGAITAVLQDRRGFLWLGTEDGLSRYDGREVKRFIHLREDPTSLPSNWISALTEDDLGRLWVSTDSGGIVWRDPLTGHFHHPSTADGTPLLDPQSQIRTAYRDQQRIWLGMRESGLIVFDVAAGTVHEYRHDAKRADSLSDDSVLSLAADSSGQLWVGMRTGLDRLDPQSGRVTHYSAMLSAVIGANAGPANVNAVLVDGRDIVWVATNKGLIRLDVRASLMTWLHHNDKDERSLPNDRVNSLLQDDEHRLWVGTATGLALLDRRTNTFDVSHNEPANLQSLPDSNIVSLYQDRGGLLWIGTKSGGAARWNPRSSQFGHIRFADSERNNVTSFAVDSHDTLWIGSFGGGLTTVDNLGHFSRIIRPDMHSKTALADPNVMALSIDDHDRVWLGTMGAGVERLDPSTGFVKRFGFDPKNPASLPAPGVMCLLRAARGTVWVGTYGGGVASIEPKHDTVTRFPVAHDSDSALTSDRATALAEDLSGLIWIGTDGGGLNVFDPSSGRFVHFRHDPRNAASLAADTVYALYPDGRGHVWVGTRGGGMDRVSGDPFAPQGVRFENISESEGLPNSTVYGIVPDALGRLWLSTNGGLAEYDPVTRKVRVFRRSHGLQSDEFNFGAHYRSDAGIVYFGGPNGYNAFHPESLRFNTRPPQIALTELLRVNTPVSATPESTSALQLDYRDSLVTFRFAALDFTGPQENRYQYRLEGFDEQWIDAGHLGQASYTNLSGGRYVFRARAANSDGVWSEGGLTVTLQVAPAPWNTWWARTLYAATILGVILAAWFTQRRHTQREAAYARRLRVEVDERTAEIAASHRQLELVNRQLLEASVTDPLTGLGNRRHLREAMPRVLSASQATHVLMIIDLDHLKPVNDQYGHEAGDVVLIRVAEILRQLFRSTDPIVRWGGDEFVAVCSQCDLQTASVLAERVRSAVAKTVFRVADGVMVRSSCSIGFATVPFVPEAPDLLGWEQSMILADAALYRAKRERNTWFGWTGRPAAAQVTSLLSALELDAEALEQAGVLDVRRPSAREDDTLNRMKTIR